ncbi:hypothetical protein MKW92_040442 [Papaver armeniacum]|nr:hypothetical protein MKW92_040442 [Papaver armeniacum]
MVLKWGHDIINIIVAITPLYVAVILGFVSVKWFKFFSQEQCSTINRFTSYFTLPFFTFNFFAHVNPFDWNYAFLGADAFSKLIILIVLVAWVKCSSNGSWGWLITNFSLLTITNSAAVGVPVLKAMYGDNAVALVSQGYVIQQTVWSSVLMFIFEFHKASQSSQVVDADVVTDLEGNKQLVVVIATTTRPSFWHPAKIVLLKLACNPNTYAEMPRIIDGSVLIMQKAAIGCFMFTIGLVTALPEKVIACGTKLAAFSLVLRFFAGPAAMAVGCRAVGLHGDNLHIAVIQAALPLPPLAYAYAKEYGLHADVICSALIIGTMVSLPVLMVYFVAFGYL